MPGSSVGPPAELRGLIDRPTEHVFFFCLIGVVDPSAGIKSTFNTGFSRLVGSLKVS